MATLISHLHYSVVWWDEIQFDMSSQQVVWPNASTWPLLVPLVGPKIVVSGL